MNGKVSPKQARRILGRVAADNFVGRTDELQQIVSHPRNSGEGRGLLLLMAPSAGVSELLRQSYDQLFHRREDIVPIYFALTRGETTAVSAAIEFLNTFLLQYVAFRRNEPSLCEASITLKDLVQLAPPADLEWIEQLVEGYNRERFGNDDRAFVRFCLSAPQRVPKRNGCLYVMIDGAQVADSPGGRGDLAAEMMRIFSRSNLPFVIAGLRRQVLDAAHRASCNFDFIDILRLGKLEDEEARRLVEHVATRQRVVINDETRDLLVQQFECSPFFVTALLQAARERNVALDTYLDCEHLYVDELMGGRIQRYFAALLEEIAPQPETRRTLVRLLCEAAVGEGRKFSFEVWRKKLHLDPAQLEKLLLSLHIQEFINWDGSTIEAGGGSATWKDYLQVRFRLDILNEPRALVVAATITDALKRAPHTMARHYHRVTTLGLRPLLTRFNCQLVPQSLFSFQEFNNRYKALSNEEISSGLDRETDLIRLPQVVHVASCAAFNPELQRGCDEERCIVAHTFEGATYTDADQVIWLVAEVESNLEADRDLTEMWCERLQRLARNSGFARTRIWLISKQGFSEAALQAIDARDGYASSRQQVQLLTARISDRHDTARQSSEPDEYVMILPMAEDNELLAASTVEQIARRLNFRPEAIRQIKHAIVEAYINASEHSLSPDRKIYQRFRVESDRLVITISSRGVVPSNLAAQSTDQGTAKDESETAQERGGWGLKLIRSLMDEVEFERVDEGTSLRMTKYLRTSSP
ncbi:MAG: ATP-binding protein [Acidobacteriota bacterium]|nr:ATP-binding protein [Acidobacteriota bacterium]